MLVVNGIYPVVRKTQGVVISPTPPLIYLSLVVFAEYHVSVCQVAAQPGKDDG